MSLIYGFDINERDDYCVEREPYDILTIKTKTCTKKIEKYNEPRTVIVFDSSVILLGITTTSIHGGKIYYSVFNSSRTVLVEKIYADQADYFTIHNEEKPNTMTKLYKTYAISSACSIVVWLSSDKEPFKIIPLSNPIALNIVLHYIEIPNKYSP